MQVDQKYGQMCTWASNSGCMVWGLLSDPAASCLLAHLLLLITC